MTFSSKDQALEAVIGGLSRVARAVVAIPVESRTRALAAESPNGSKLGRYGGGDPGMDVHNHVALARGGGSPRVGRTDER
jgi:hypothetical protein